MDDGQMMDGWKLVHASLGGQAKPYLGVTYREAAWATVCHCYEVSHDMSGDTLTDNVATSS